MKYWLSLLFEPVEQLVDLARLAEEVGFEGVVLPDHVVLKVGDKTPHPKGYPTDPEDEYIDPFCAFSAMAAVTQRLRFMNYVYVVPLRDPFTVAKQAASVARLSSNRLVLGTGVGWLPEEFDTIGSDFASRGARFDEALDIITDFWDDGYAEHHGAHYDFPRSAMFPPPTERIPIVIGGDSMVAARRAARFDGYILMRGGGLDEQTRREFVAIDELRRDAGRTGPFERIVFWPGSTDKGAARQLEDGGVTAAVVAPWAMGDRSLALDDKRAAADRFASTLLSSAGV